MALIKLGALAAAVSGRIGGSVFSHNRGGAYVRTWAKPHRISSQAAEKAKGIVSEVSRGWADLSADDRAAWSTYAIEKPSINRLGESRTLSGAQAFMRINARIAWSAGSAVAIPPTVAPPAPLTVSAFTVDVSSVTANIVFAPTPLTGTDVIWVWGCVVDSPGITFLSNRLRLIAVSALLASSPLNVYGELEARFGTLQPGQVVHVRAQVVSSTSGLESGYSPATAIVTA